MSSVAIDLSLLAKSGILRSLQNIMQHGAARRYQQEGAQQS